MTITDDDAAPAVALSASAVAESGGTATVTATLDRVSSEEAGRNAQNEEGREMSYVESFVAAVPNANREAFREHAEAMAKVFKGLGALSVVDCWGDDVPDGEVTSFPMAVKCREDETVVFGWMIWPSREVRDAAHEKFMADMRAKPEENPMPFDGKRLIHGGFEMLVEA